MKKKWQTTPALSYADSCCKKLEVVETPLFAGFLVVLIHEETLTDQNVASATLIVSYIASFLKHFQRSATLKNCTAVLDSRL
jgi:hypothetical protein